MADPRLRLPANVAGSWFVDSTCIDCDACRLLAPAVFDRAGGQSFVAAQPQSKGDREAAGRALVACPTGSIGTADADVSAAVASFPMRMDGEVWMTGFNSSDSFGAFAWLLVRPEGNILVDSPRFTRPLVRKVEEMGGVSLIALTHRDDVADHAKWAAHFGAERVLHRRDVTASTRDVERQPDGEQPIDLGGSFLMIPTPGHTRGHAVYLDASGHLFTGDHLAWNRERGTLYAFRNACWYSWHAQIASMERLLDYEFRWVLPGHGAWARLSPPEMRASLESCIAWMKARA